MTRYRNSRFLLTACVLAAPHDADGTSEPDAAAGDEGSRSAWSLRRVTRYGVVRWIGALLHGKTRGSARSDLELVNAAILQQTRRRHASESGEQRKMLVEASPSASALLETAPQVRRKAPIRWPRFQSPLVHPTEAPQLRSSVDRCARSSPAVALGGAWAIAKSCTGLRFRSLCIRFGSVQVSGLPVVVGRGDISRTQAPSARAGSEDAEPVQRGVC